MKKKILILINLLGLFINSLYAQPTQQNYTHGETCTFNYTNYGGNPVHCIKVYKQTPYTLKTSGIRIASGVITDSFVIPCDWEPGIYQINQGDDLCQDANMIGLFLLTDKNISQSSNLTFCTTDTVNVTLASSFVNTGGNYEWYYDSNMLIPVEATKFINAQKNVLNYSAAGQTTATYYYRGKNSYNCYTPLSSLTVTINQGITNLQITNNNTSICKGDTQVFYAGANGSNIQYRFWQDAAGTIPLISGVSSNSYTANTTSMTAGLKTFWVDAFNSAAPSCKTALLPVSYTVLEKPTNLNVINNNGTYCTGDTILITPSATNATSYEWANDINFLQLLTTEVDAQGRLNYIALIPTANRTLYVRAVNSNGCTSQPLTVTFSIKQGVSNLNVSNNNAIICQFQPITFQAGAINETSYSFYSNSSLTIPITTGVNGSTYTPNTSTPGSYSFWVVASNFNGCNTQALQTNYTIIAAPSNLTTSGNTTICQGDQVSITPSATNATSYEWAEDAAFNIPVNPSNINGNKLEFTPTNFGATNYYVRAVNANGCKSASNLVTITTNETPQNVTVTNQNIQVCQGDTISFVVGTSSSGSINYQFWSNASGTIPITSGVNGNTYTVNTSAIVPNTYSFWVTATKGNCKTQPLLVNYVVLVKPTNLTITGALSVCQGEQISIDPVALNATSYQWSTDFNFTVPVNPSNIVGNKLEFIANNIGITNYYVRGVNANGCTTTPMLISVTVKQSAINLSVNNNNAIVCQNNPISFTAVATNATNYAFYSNASLTTNITTGVAGNVYTPSTTTNGNFSFWVLATNTNGCNSQAVQIDYQVIPNALNLTTSGNTTICQGQLVSITPSATNAADYLWAYDANFVSLVEDTKIVGNKLEYTAASIGTTNYYVKAINWNNCETVPQLVTITINEAPQNLSVTNSGASVCKGDTILFSAGATSTGTISYNYWSNATATTAISSGVSGANYTINTSSIAPGTYSFWVTANVGTCRTSPVLVTYTVKVQPTNLITSGNLSYCTGNTVLITPSALNATSYAWSYDPNFNNLVEASKIDANGRLNFLATTAVASQIYYVKALNSNGCSSTVNSVTIVINQSPMNLSVINNDTIVCQNSVVNFTAGANNATGYLFYADQGLTFPITTGVSGNTYTPSTAVTGNFMFYVVASNTNGCNSNSVQVNYQVTPAPFNLTYLGNLSYCIGDNVLITPSATNAVSYQFAYDPNFMIMVEASKIDANGRLNYTTTTSGNQIYYLRAIGSTGCYSTPITINIETKIAPSNLYVNTSSSTICKGNTNQFTVSANNATLYIWSQNSNFSLLAPSSMVTGANNSILNLDTTNMAIGSYTWYVKAVNSNGCLSLPISFSFTIVSNIGNTIVNVVNSIICSNELFTVNLTNNTPNTNINWFIDSSATPLNTSYISNNGRTINVPGTSFTIGNNVLYYQVSNANCSSNLIPITFTVKLSPSSLNITNQNASVCKGDVIIFEASAFNTNMFNYYSDSNLLLPINSAYISGEKNFRLSLPTTNYNPGTYSIYVQATSLSGCVSPPLTITFTVNQIPGPTSISGNTTYCLNDNIIFNLTNANSNQFFWYSDPNALNIIPSIYLINNGATLNMPATNTGNNTLYFKAKNTSGCFSALQSVDFTVLPAPTNLIVTNNLNTYCEEDTIEIIAGANNATEFEWYTNASGTVLVNSTFLQGTLKERYKPIGLTDGTYSVWVRAKNAQGCRTTLTRVDFVIVTKPTINTFATLNGNSIFILGNSIVFNINGNNYNQYKILKNNNNFIPNNNGFLLGNISQYILTNSATQADEGVYKLILSNGSCTEEVILKIIVIPYNIVISHDKMNSIKLDSGVQKVVLKRHEDIQFTTNINFLPNYTFKWKFGDSFENSIGKHYYNNSGEYNVSIDITNTVLNETFTLNYTLPIKILSNSENIEVNPFDPTVDSIIIFPNPVIDNIKLKINNAFSNYTAIVRIFNLEGITVFAETLNIPSGLSEHEFISPLLGKPNGTYILRYYKDDNYYKNITIIKK